VDSDFVQQNNRFNPLPRVSHAGLGDMNHEQPTKYYKKDRNYSMTYSNGATAWQKRWEFSHPFIKL